MIATQNQWNTKQIQWISAECIEQHCKYNEIHTHTMKKKTQQIQWTIYIYIYIYNTTYFNSVMQCKAQLNYVTQSNTETSL